MADVQPSSQTAPEPSSDSLIDRYLDGLDNEDTERRPRKAAKAGDPEMEAPEDEPQPYPEEDTPEGECEEEGEDTAAEDDAEAEEEDDQSELGRFVGQDGRVKLPDGSTTTV